MSKPQDGLVSRYLNRPISRYITRYLLEWSIHPSAWTMSIFVLPMLACAFLLRGDYGSIVIGTAMYQLYSILDGCDGEIARARNLESKFGEWLDNTCDLISSIFFLMALGIGIRRPGEALICAAAIGTSEYLLSRGVRESASTSSAVGQTLYPRHRGMVEGSGLLALGEGFVSAIFQATKRDVAIFVFFLLALFDRPNWILHLWTTVALASLVLSTIAYRKSKSRS
ncbi:MAG: CDP-alcohol phosphatidyltransferase family protein [Spartobacteria bacterium]